MARLSAPTVLICGQFVPVVSGIWCLNVRVVYDRHEKSRIIARFITVCQGKNDAVYTL